MSIENKSKADTMRKKAWTQPKIVDLDQEQTDIAGGFGTTPDATSFTES